MNIPGLENLKFYIVRNSDGQFFHAIGYGGYGETWVEDVTQARIYAKIGPARTQVTYFARHFPNYPIPVILEISVGEVKELQETERVAKAIKKIEKEKQQQKIWDAEEKLRRAKKQKKDAQKVIDSLEGE